MSLLLNGIVPPLITPLKGRDELDAEGLEKLVEYVLSGGVHGLFLLGSTGEAPGLSYRLRRELVERVCRLVNERVPVLVGITDSSIVEALNMADCAAEAGASAVVASTPFYFPAGQEELGDYFERLAEDLPLPLVLYNMPGFTKTSISIETVCQLAQNPKIIGVKDSSCDMIHFHRLLQTRPEREDWSLLMGPEELTAEAVLMGASGGVCGGANVAPKLFVELYDAALKRDIDRIQILQAQALRMGQALYRTGKHSSSMIKGIKCALSLLGICDDFMADPASRFKKEERQSIEGQLATSGIRPWLSA